MAGLVRVVKRERIEPPSRTARRFAPGIATPLRAGGARRRVAMRRYFLVKGGVPPFTLSPRSRGQRTECAAIYSCWLGSASTRERRSSGRHGGAQARERRPPVGTARRRRADGVQLSYGVSPTSTTALVEVRAAVPTIPMFDVRPVRCASRSGAGPHRENWPLAWRSVVGAGFALPRDAGRRPALHVPVILRGWRYAGSQP